MKGPTELSSTHNTKQDNSWLIAWFIVCKQYIYKNGLLALLKGVYAAGTQPIQVTMRQQQSALDAEPPQLLSARQSFLKIFYGEERVVNQLKPAILPPENKSTYQLLKAMNSFFSKQEPSQAKQYFIRPFYNGGEWAVKKELLRYTYKGTLLVRAPGWAESIVNQSFSGNLSPVAYQVIKLNVAALIAATIDVALGGGFEAAATFYATAQGKDSEARFSDKIRAAKTLPQKISLIWRGAPESLLKSHVTFATNYLVDKPISNWMMRLWGLTAKDKKPVSFDLICAFAMSSVVAVVGSPIDIAKTGKQKAEKHEPEMQKTSVAPRQSSTLLYNTFKSFGWRGLMVGVPLKCVMATGGWTLNNFAFKRWFAQPAAIEKTHLEPESRKVVLR